MTAWLYATLQTLKRVVEEAIILIIALVDPEIMMAASIKQYICIPIAVRT